MFQVNNCKVIPFTRIQEDLPKDAGFRAPVGTHKIALQWLATAEGLFEMKCDAQKCSLFIRTDRISRTRLFHVRI